ncbi:MAG: peptidylprolyl isomerase [Xanthomonadales bacterium]|nr:peptidylprolyl isomerase [Xanthomonadales bacterium]
MKKLATLFVFAVLATQTQAQTQDPRVWLDTDYGPIIVELDPGAAPVTVENFLKYTDDGFYDGTVFHRVVEDFVIQGGGFEDGIVFKEPTYDPIENEADNGLLNTRGTISMARSSDPASATSQFFINTVDNDNLDPNSESAGYAVFGEVVFGLENVDKIAALNTSSLNTQYGTLRDYPRSSPTIRRAVRTNGFPLMPDHSGSWYDPQTDGVGFNIEIADDNAGNGPIANVYWYNFDEQRQFWLVGSTPFDYGATEVTVELFSHPADEEGTGFQNPPESNFSSYGTLTLSFSDCTSGTVAYDMPGYGNGEIAIARLSQPDDYNCGG